MKTAPNRIRDLVLFFGFGEPKSLLAKMKCGKIWHPSFAFQKVV